MISRRRTVRSLFSRRVQGTLLLGLALGAILAPATAQAAQTVKFRLVIEGDVNAIRNFSASGTDSLCEESLKGEFQEYTRFLRGRGVTLEITRRKVNGVVHYGVRRAGQGPAEFTVQAESTRKASGTEVIELSPTGKQLAAISPGIKCPNVLPDLSHEGGCGVALRRQADVGMKIAGILFTVKASPKGRVPAPFPKPECGESVLTAGFLGLDHEFPHFAPVDLELLPASKMFGRANAIAVKLAGVETGQPKPIKAITLTGSATDDGASEIITRFIRCGERRQPAC